MNPLNDLLELTRQAFAENGPLCRRIPHYRCDALQLDYAVRVAKTLQRGGQPDDPQTAITLLQAETGIGKSLGYLIPLTLYSALTGQRVGVSTHTLHLQRQLTDPVAGDLAIALAVTGQLTGKHLHWATRKGLQNFVSAARIDHVVRHHPQTPVPDELLAFQHWAMQAGRSGSGGELQDWKENHGDALPLALHDSDVCLQTWDSEDEKVCYREHADAARHADLVLITHTLLLLNNYRWFSLLDGDERTIAAMVVDEADRLERAAETIYQRIIPLNSVSRLCQALGEHFGKATARVEHAITALRKTMDNIHAERGGRNYRHEFCLLLNDVDGMVYRERIKKLVSAATRAVSAAVADTRLRDQLSRLQPEQADAAKAFLNLELDLKEFNDTLQTRVKSSNALMAPALRWSPVQSWPSLSTIPLYPGRLTARLWQSRQLPGEAAAQAYLNAIVLTSATLSAPGSDMRDFESQIGIQRDRHHVCVDLNAQLEPDEFGRVNFILADPRVPSPTRTRETAANDYTSAAWLDYCAGMIDGARARGGRVLALVTSYQNGEALGQRLQDVIVHQRGRRLGDYLSEFQSNDNAVWITPCAWEGLNLPGCISHLVLTRLPFPVVDSGRSIALKDRLITQGIDKKTAASMIFALSRNIAKRLFRQGLGRGIRKFDDACTIWIADPRFPIPAARLMPWLINHEATELPDNIYSDFNSCIPRRFREGLYGTYDNAEIWTCRHAAIITRR